MVLLTQNANNQDREREECVHVASVDNFVNGKAICERANEEDSFVSETRRPIARLRAEKML